MNLHHNPAANQYDVCRGCAAGLGMEDTQMIIEGMAMQGAEPTYCMGDDSPLPVLSSRPHALADYFKQRFAQVRQHDYRSSGSCKRWLILFGGHSLRQLPRLMIS